MLGFAFTTVPVLYVLEKVCNFKRRKQAIELKLTQRIKSDAIMKILIIAFAIFAIAGLQAAEPKVLVEDKFTEVNKSWHWSLGTWTAKDGVLHGFESGPRRHGPVTMQKLAFTDATFDFSVRLIGRAHWASVVFNNDDGHLFIVTLARSNGTLIINKSADKNDPDSKAECIAEVPFKVAPDVWHHIRICIAGETISVDADEVNATGKHAVIAKAKMQFGLSGDSGGPEGEKAGSLEFRDLIITAP